MGDRRRTATVALCSLIATALLVCASCAPATVPSTTGSNTVAEGQIWPDDVVPGTTDDSDGRPMELGTAFTPASNGTITGVRFYQASEDTGASSATVWTSDGARIATAPIPPGPNGWREIPLDRAVPIESGREYVVSYQASRGHHAVEEGTFSQGSTIESGWLTALDGVFTYGEGFPDERSNGDNYFVDVTFEASGPSLRPVDGGDRYYDAFTNSIPSDAGFFPLAVWYTRTTTSEEVAADRALGLNVYIELSEDSNLQLIRDGGMYAIPGWSDPLAAGRLTTDEADMWAGAGDAPWTGRVADPPICIPENAHCGFTVMSTLRSQVPPGVMAYANYGKGVTFWESTEDAERFVNDFQHVVSADNYWFTDRGICRAHEGGVLRKNGESDLSDAECQLAANYGLTTRYIRSLVRPRFAMPVWNFVELGHPAAPENDGTITGPQIRGAVWSSIINGARGIIYFAHNFGGPCLSYNLLRDRCGDGVRNDVTALNQQIGRLAPVLNAPFVDGFARSRDPVDLAVKYYEGSFYILAGSTQNPSSDVTIELTCGTASEAEVIDENRSVPITDNELHDTFIDGNAVHLYRIRGIDGCAPQ